MKKIFTDSKPTGYKSLLHRHKKPLFWILTLILVSLFLLHRIHGDFSFLWPSKESNYNTHLSVDLSGDSEMESELRYCNIFRGKWVPHPKGPYYTNETGCVIESAQNCMKYGRPDTRYMYWRWRPNECELPLFNAAQFLVILRGKSMAFVGDSVARNHVQSLGCMLSSAARPVDKSDSDHPRFRRWEYPDYNFTLALLTTTHLVKSRGINAMSGNPVSLYLDEVEDSWSSQIDAFDYVVLSGGHWFTRPLTYYEKGEVIGCSMCTKPNVTDLTKFYGFRQAFRTSFRALLDHRGFEGTVILRTISPSHFEAEEWEERGYCLRTMPLETEEMKLDWDTWLLYLIQVEEFLAAKREAKKKRVDFKLLDITEAMRPRADGHPNHYGHPVEVRFMMYSDCLHWCLPGAIDTWNELLLQVLKTGDFLGFP
ncbi:hypothetical protein NMG60_11006236 [Bertholletia excelsa]